MTTAARLRLTFLFVAACTLTVTAQQQSGSEEFARRQYESGMTFYQNRRYAEALKDLQAVVDSFATTSVADNALLQIAQYQLDVAHDIAAAQTSIDKLLKDYPDADAAPMGHVLSGRLALTKGRATTDVDAAMASFERVSRLFPGSEAVAAAGYYAGDTLRIVRRTGEALDRFRRVELEYPRSQWAARAAMGAGYCLVQLDRGVQALPEVQWVRQQFPGTPVAQDALNLNTIIYRLYLRQPAQPSYGFSGRTIGDVKTEYRDIVRLSLEPDGRLLLGHKGGVTIFDDKGAVAGSVPSQEPTSFFIDEKGRIVFAKSGTLTADKGETQTLFIPEKDGKVRELDQIPSVIINYKGDRLVADAKGHAVLRIGPDGKYVGQFANLDALRMISNGLGDIAILEKGDKSVQFVDRDGKALGKLTAKGPGYELSDPVDIAFDALDQLYILDRGKGAVFVFGAKNKFITTLSISEKNPGSFTKPVAMSIDPAGRLFIYDERAKRIQVYQ